MKKVKCPRCLGTGLIPDQAVVGGGLRKSRTRSLRDVALDMGISAAHLSLLERGKRRWTPDLVERHRKACG